MATPEELENRVTVLEREVARLRELSGTTSADAGAARVLAAGADHDVSEVRAELRAHLRAINALRETQMEMQLELRGLGGSVQGLRGSVRGLEGSVRGLEGSVQELREIVIDQDRRMSEGFSTMGVGMAQIAALLHTITGPDQD